jgi:hypothetical protein
MKLFYKVALTMFSIGAYPSAHRFWSEHISNVWLFGVMMISCVWFLIGTIYYIWTGKEL